MAQPPQKPPSVIRYVLAPIVAPVVLATAYGVWVRANHPHSEPLSLVQYRDECRTGGAQNMIGDFWLKGCGSRPIEWRMTLKKVAGPRFLILASVDDPSLVFDVTLREAAAWPGERKAYDPDAYVGRTLVVRGRAARSRPTVNAIVDAEIALDRPPA